MPRETKGIYVCGHVIEFSGSDPIAKRCPICGAKLGKPKPKLEETYETPKADMLTSPYTFSKRRKTGLTTEVEK